MKLNIISQEQLVEGIIASIVFPLSVMFYKNYEKKSFFIYTMLAWITTWIMRKLVVNIYHYYYRKHNLKHVVYSINI